MVQAILQTYGYSQRREGETQKRQQFSDFFYKYVLPAVTFGGIGHELSESSPILASMSFLLGLAVFLRGLSPWCNTRSKTIALVAASAVTVILFVWRDYNWIKEERTPTFLYLVPTHELIDCERRAFFVNHSGHEHLQNLQIIIKDNGSGAVLESNDYKSGIEPGPQNPDAPRYIWLKPSHPWDEDYTITISGTNYHSVQETVLRSKNKNVELAVRITLDSMKDPVASCRDSTLPESISLGRESRQNCGSLMYLDPRFLNRLQPQFYGLQPPSGDYVAVKLRTLPPASDLDFRSEDRHLTEYEQTTMRSNLSRYRGTKLLILYTGGPRTLAFATELRQFFRSIAWRTDGPRPVPTGNERLVDVQISVSSRYWSVPDARATDLQSSLAGVKRRRRYIYDEAIPADLIVLWVGPRSPDSFRPDDCAPAALRPRIGEPNSCKLVAQTPDMCPTVPQ